MSKSSVIVIAVIAALAGGAVGAGFTYVFFPKTDPELKALIERQVKLAEKEQADKAAAEAAVKDFMK